MDHHVRHLGEGDWARRLQRLPGTRHDRARPTAGDGGPQDATTDRGHDADGHDAVRAQSPGRRTTVRAQGPGRPPDPDTGWREAEEIAAALRGAGDPAMPSVPRLRETLLRCADGNETLADMIRDVLTGWHLLGPLWRDDRVTEIHVRGVRVTALGIGGVHELADFPDPGSARAAVETVTRAAADVGAVVTAVGGFTVVRRRDGAHPDAGSLVAEGVMEAELLSRVADAIERMRAVTVTGPAAPRITLTLASLIPAGSRVFQGPFGRLPAGCVAVAGPLEADYVTGTRPGEPAEGMAAGGQIGAVIANPETDIPAQVRLAVTGRTAAPTRVTAR
ncbi:hypothetical protein LUW74_43785 [Actinomadura madurae]|uniref:hypothetical protein n=1 Tax=Actinomadura madurae TaxID=1993 RepID=UPI00202660A7|nr:hypothetical protein [Actinomadura madurae]URN09597.1 hypothetical protein LUW74_43785 [Actinomadura madurae]